MKPNEIKLEVSLRRLEYDKYLDPVFYRVIADPVLSAELLHGVEMQSIFSAMERLGPKMMIPGIVQGVIKADLFDTPDMTTVRAAFVASNTVGMYLGIEPIWDDVHDEVSPGEDASALEGIYWDNNADPDATMVTLMLRISYNLWLVL